MSTRITVRVPAPDGDRFAPDAAARSAGHDGVLGGWILRLVDIEVVDGGAAMLLTYEVPDECPLALAVDLASEGGRWWSRGPQTPPHEHTWGPWTPVPAFADRPAGAEYRLCQGNCDAMDERGT